jgi:hypothetical protein
MTRPPYGGMWDGTHFSRVSSRCRKCPDSRIFPIIFANRGIVALILRRI